MDRILKRVIQDRKILFFVLAMILISGLYGYHVMPRQETPEIVAPVAIVTCTYPGASPKDVERLVTRKIEDEIKEVAGLDVYNSTAMDSASVTMVVLDVGADLNKSFASLREKMDDIQGDLPAECSDISVNTEWFETTGMMISLSGKAYSYDDLESYAEKVKKRLVKISGMEKIEVVGKLEKEVTVEIDAAKLNSYGFSLSDIQQVIALQNTEIPSGKLDGTSGKLNVKAEGTFSTLEEVQNIILDVSPVDGSLVRLKDVADIGLDLEDSVQKIKYNDENAILLTGYFKKDRNIVLIGDDVRKEIQALKAELPEGLRFEEVLYQPETVRNSVNNFIFSLLQGVLFVMVVVFLGMGFRNALVVSIAIPASLITTFTVMWVTGSQIHQISIAALIIALGMLVDNAIVVSDAIQVRLDQDEDRLSACVSGALEVAMPVLTSTLTTMAVFLPLLFLDSMAGRFIRSLPLVVMVSLTASYLVALFVTPTLAYLFFKKSSGIQKQGLARRVYSRIITYAFSHKAVVLGILCMALGGAWFLYGRLGLEFFPKADTNLLYINVTNDSDSDLNKTEVLADQVTTILKQQPEITDWTVSVGDSLPKFYYTLPVSAPSKAFAQIAFHVDLAKANRFKENGSFGDALQVMLDSQLSGGKAVVKELEQGEPLGAPVRLKISGGDQDSLALAKNRILAEMAAIPGTVNIEDDQDDQVFQYYVDVDLPKANYFGITKYDVQNEVSIALYGRTASVFRGTGIDQDIVVKSDIVTKEALENLMIKSSFTGNKVLLKNLAQIQLQTKIPTIHKHNGEETVSISCQVLSGYNSVVIQSQLKDRLKDVDLGPVTAEFDGEEQSINEEFGGIGSSAVLALFLIYFILLLEFESFLQPIIIFVTIPLSAVGSILGLYLFGQPLSFTALFGLVSLFGVVVNNAIILIDYINLEVASGKELKTACLDAVEKRFRPIMLTTLTTVIGLVPMILSRTALFTPMAISLMSGLLVSTLLTLVVVPLVYHSVMKRVVAER